MDIRLQIVGTLFFLLMLALLIVATFRQRKILKELKKSQKFRKDCLRKV